MFDKDKTNGAKAAFQGDARPDEARRSAAPSPAQNVAVIGSSIQINGDLRGNEDLRIEGDVNLQTLAQRMSLKATDVLMKLMQLGMTGVNINSSLDVDTT